MHTDQFRVLARIEKLPVQRHKNEALTNLRYTRETYRSISGSGLCMKPKYLPHFVEGRYKDDDDRSSGGSNIRTMLRAPMMTTPDKLHLPQAEQR